MTTGRLLLADPPTGRSNKQFIQSSTNDIINKNSSNIYIGRILTLKTVVLKHPIPTVQPLFCVVYDDNLKHNHYDHTVKRQCHCMLHANQTLTSVTALQDIIIGKD